MDDENGTLRQRLRARRRCIVGWLRGPAGRAQARRAADRQLVLARAASYRPRTSEVASVWHLVVCGLDHQGAPRANLDRMIGILDGGRSGISGWDEFSIDYAPELSPTAVISFIRDARHCDGARLLTELLAFREALDT